MFDIEQQLKDTKIRLCLDCGKCTVVCPVAQYDPDFNPRLIAQRRLGKSNTHIKDETIWDCLSCYMCVERCNYLVNFPEFIHSVRAEALQEGERIPCSHGGALQSLMRIMARDDLEQDRMDWLPNNIELSKESDTIFFVGCSPYFDVIFSDLGVNTLEGAKGTVKLLNHTKIPFDIIENERCCGRDLLLDGDREGFTALAEANMEEFKNRGVKKIICNCSECYYTLKTDYPKILGQTGIEVLHLSEVLAPLIKNGDLGLGKIEVTSTFHDPCSLGRCSRIFDAPRQLLDAATNHELVEMEQNRETALCCGSSPWAHCGAVNRQIQEQRLGQAQSTGADIMVTACPKCQIHFRCAQKGDSENVPQIDIKDLASILAQSLD